MADDTGYRAYWNGPSDGPYMHVDDIIRYLTRSNDKNPNARIFGLATRFTQWKADCTSSQLHKVTGTAPSNKEFKADLIALREELE